MRIASANQIRVGGPISAIVFMPKTAYKPQRQPYLKRLHAYDSKQTPQSHPNPAYRSVARAVLYFLLVDVTTGVSRS